MDPVFLELAEVVQIHRDQLDQYGGAEGLRDLGLLQSALAMPKAGVGEMYFHEDLCAMAAAYLFHIVQNHPFVDGNKRVGAVAAFVFLALNGIDLVAPEDEFEALVWGIAGGKLNKTDATLFFRKNTTHLP